MAVLDSVNLGRPRANPDKKGKATGIGKRPIDDAVEVRAPGSKADGLGSGLIGDFIGDRKHHGGDGQAVYAYAREDLDGWQRELGRELPNGSFGENLTTRGLNVTDARLGEQWRIGSDVVLQVTTPRIPCATFRGFLGVPGWLKIFTAAGHPGAHDRARSDAPFAGSGERPGPRLAPQRRDRDERHVLKGRTGNVLDDRGGRDRWGPRQVDDLADVAEIVELAFPVIAHH